MLKCHLQTSVHFSAAAQHAHLVLEQNTKGPQKLHQQALRKLQVNLTNRAAC